MSSTLVSRYITILRSLSEGYKGKNEIVRHTGVKWNKPILEAIKDLQKAGFIAEGKKRIDSRDNPKRRHIKKGKKQLQILTPLGQEILNILSIASRYKEYISRFKQTLNERVFCVPPECLTMLNDMKGCLYRDIMHDKNSQTVVTDDDLTRLLHKYKYILKEECGWYDKEIEFYNECRVGMVNFLVFCEQRYDYILRLRYA